MRQHAYSISLDRPQSFRARVLLAPLDLFNKFTNPLLSLDFMDPLLHFTQSGQFLRQDVSAKVEVWLGFGRQGELDGRAEFGRVGSGECDPCARWSGVSKCALYIGWWGVCHLRLFGNASLSGETDGSVWVDDVRVFPRIVLLDNLQGLTSAHAKMDLCDDLPARRRHVRPRNLSIRLFARPCPNRPYRPFSAYPSIPSMSPGRPLVRPIPSRARGRRVIAQSWKTA